MFYYSHFIHSQVKKFWSSFKSEFHNGKCNNSPKNLVNSLNFICVLFLFCFSTESCFYPISLNAFIYSIECKETNSLFIHTQYTVFSPVLTLSQFRHVKIFIRIHAMALHGSDKIRIVQNNSKCEETKKNERKRNEHIERAKFLIQQRAYKYESTWALFCVIDADRWWRERETSCGYQNRQRK